MRQCQTSPDAYALGRYGGGKDTGPNGATSEPAFQKTWPSDMIRNRDIRSTGSYVITSFLEDCYESRYVGKYLDLTDINKSVIDYYYYG
jgi:hypothetical protein